MNDFFSFFRKKRRKEVEYTPESDFPLHETYTKQEPIQRIQTNKQDIKIKPAKGAKKKR